MVYQRVRNSSYASYSRACDAQGRRAQFSIPMRTANFSPYDMLNHAVSMGGDMFNHVGQYVGDAARGVGNMVNHANDMPKGMGQLAGDALTSANTQNAVRAMGGNAMNPGGFDLGPVGWQQGIQDTLRGAYQSVGDYFNGNPDAANAAKAAAGVTGIAGGAAAGGRIIRGLGPQGAQMAEEVAPAVMGLRQRAGALLKNPYAQAGAGAAALGAGAYGANQMMNRDQ